MDLSSYVFRGICLVLGLGYPVGATIWGYFHNRKLGRRPPTNPFGEHSRAP
jgi:hypothetical protein